MKKKTGIILALLMCVATASNALIKANFMVDERLYDLQQYSANQDSGNGVAYDLQKDVSLNDLIKAVMDDYLKVAAVLYDIKKADSSYESFLTKYSPYLSASTSYSGAYFPDGSSSAMLGSKVKNFDWEASIAKKYSTGTEVAVGLANNINDANDPYNDPTVHSPQIFLSVSQQLLKNSFGINDRQIEDILKKQMVSDVMTAKYQLSQLIAGVVSDYWTASVAYRDLCDTEIELNVYKMVRNKLKENVGLGLVEPYTLNQFNALVYVSEIKLDQARYNYYDSLKNIKKIMNLSENKVTIVPLFMTNKTVALDKEKLLKNAFANRPDYQSVLNNLEISKMNIDIYKNESMPELKAGFKYAGLGRDRMFVEALGDATGAQRSSSELSLSMSYMFDNKANEVNVRNSEYQYEQAKLEKNRIENDIKYELDDALRQVELSGSSLKKVKLAGKEVDTYINSLLARLAQGKVSTAVMQDAVDMLVLYRTTQTQTINALNLALLNVDMVTNTLFEKNGINVDEYMEKLEGVK